MQDYPRLTRCAWKVCLVQKPLISFLKHNHAASTLIVSLSIMTLGSLNVAIASTLLFIAWSLATGWFPILKYLGYAFIAGLLVTALSIAALVLFSSRTRQDTKPLRRKSPRTVAFINAEVWDQEKTWFSEGAPIKPIALYPSSSAISNAIDDLLEWLLRDLITSWYSNISPNLQFVIEIDQAIRRVLVSIAERVRGLDAVEVSVSQIVPIFTNHLNAFYEAEVAIRGKNLNRNVTESEELDLAIARKYKSGKVHSAASLAYSDTKIVQQEYLRGIVTRLLPKVLPENLIRSRAVSVLIKEIVACAIFAPLMKLLSDPDTWNQLMEAYVLLRAINYIEAY